MAKIGRRGFLGMAAAAPIAGPAVMREAMAQRAAQGGLANKAGFAMDNGVEVGAIDEGTWLPQRIAELRRELEAPSDAKEFGPDVPAWTTHSIQSLRSISPGHKAIMERRAYLEASERRRRFWIENEINALMNRAKIIGISIF